MREQGQGKQAVFLCVGRLCVRYVKVFLFLDDVNITFKENMQRVESLDIGHLFFPFLLLNELFVYARTALFRESHFLSLFFLQNEKHIPE